MSANVCLPQDNKELLKEGVWTRPLYCVNICNCEWFNKEAGWPIARQGKVRQENQTKIMLGRRSRSLRRRHEMQSEKDGKYTLEVNTPRDSTWINRNGLI